MNKVEVNIYGKDYTVVGEQSSELIARMAAHVDEKMREMGEAVPSAPLSAVAVLSAMNIAEELFVMQEKSREMNRTTEQHEADTQRYAQLWEEAKNSLAEYRQESQKDLAAAREETEQIRTQLAAKEREVEELMRSRENDRAQANQESALAVEEVEKKYSDLENSYFELQMNNIQLKSELEKLKTRAEWNRG